MRLQGQAQMGYYPTPRSQTEKIITWLKHADKPGNALTRGLDPCCGMGQEFAYISRQLGNITTYGIELSPQRAEVATQVLGTVLPTGFKNALLTEETFSLILLNPPYDGETMTGGGERMEYTFLLPITRLLARSGVLIYIIPEGRISEDIAKHLAGWYDDLRCFRFQEDEYQVYKQVVIFGVRRFVYKQPNQEETDAVKVWAMGKMVSDKLDAFVGRGAPGGMGTHTQVYHKPLPVLCAGNGEYAVPESPTCGKKGMFFRFKYMPVSAEDYLRAAEVSAQALENSQAWQMLAPKTGVRTIAPAITPKLGHISMQVSGGLLGTNLISDPNGQPLLIKGGTEKYKVRIDRDGDEEELDYKPNDPDKRKKLFRIKVEQRARPTLYTLNAEGEMVFLNDPGSISEVLRQNVGTLAKTLEERNVPRYDMKPEKWEWDVMTPLSRGRYLPGRDEDGLTAPQKHVAIALGRLLLAEHTGFENGEMGTGKTTKSLAVVEYLRTVMQRRNSSKPAYPALVVGPGVVTGDDNWPREIREVIPGAKAAVIDAAVRPLPKPAKVKDWAKSMGIHLDDDDFEGQPALNVWKAIFDESRRQSIPLSRENLLALANTLTKAEKNPPRRRNGAEQPNLLDARIGGFRWLGQGTLPRDPNHEREMKRRYTLAQFVAEYKAGELPEKSFAVMSYETAKLGAGRVPAMGTKRVVVQTKDGREVRQVCTCPSCGRIVSKEYDDEGNPVLHRAVRPGKSARQYVGAKRRFCTAPVEKWIWNAETGEHELRTADNNGNPFVCGSPLFEYTGLRREAAARYVQRKAKNFFPVLLMDEIHEAKAKGTGNGWALSVLAKSSRYALGLTGTLFSGYSTSIFWLMHRMAPEVRQRFGFHQEMQWAKEYGLLRETFYVSSPEAVGEDGSYTGAKFLNRADERPGILPGIIGYALPRIVFASLQDMGLPLPHYTEEIIRLEMSSEMKLQYDWEADGSGRDPVPADSLYYWATQELKENKNRGGFSVWLNTALNRVNAMFRDETVMFNRRVSGKGKYAIRIPEEVMELPAVEMEAPKDLWLAERCLAERREGRKTLVFVRQTGKRDIQPHLVELLEAKGLRVGVLKPSVAPRRRVAWIKKHAPHIDVLLTNARLVKVGLNLRMFNTAVFYEIEWSLAILWQAMRRVYRPGSPLPVRILFPVYEGTLEERALNLIGQKMKAATLFYGDEVASALTEEDESDFLTDLVRSVLKGERIEKIDSIFAVENTSTASPMGSLTATSPKVVPAMTLDEWMASQGISNGRIRVRQRRQKPVAAEDQLTFF